MLGDSSLPVYMVYNYAGGAVMQATIGLLVIKVPVYQYSLRGKIRQYNSMLA